jgi:hypothetical protein
VLTSFLRDNADIFACSPSDMPGVFRELAEHKLEVNKTAQPIKKKLRRLAKDRKQAIEVEVCKLLGQDLLESVNTRFGSQTRSLYQRKLVD